MGIPTQWICESSGSSTSCTVTATSGFSVLFTQDSGNVVFGLSILIFLNGMILWGFLSNAFIPKRK